MIDRKTALSSQRYCRRPKLVNLDKRGYLATASTTELRYKERLCQAFTLRNLPIQLIFSMLFMNSNIDVALFVVVRCKTEFTSQNSTRVERRMDATSSVLMTCCFSRQLIGDI